VTDIEYLLDHDDDFTLNEVKVWPLFKELREQELYGDLLRKHEIKKDKKIELEDNDDAKEDTGAAH
jgi:hypothetical protein